MDRRIRIALIGAGMFGGDVHARAYADLQRCGISPQLGRIGLDDWARDFCDIRFELVAVATRSEKSAKRAQKNYRRWTGQAPKAFWGNKPWTQVLNEFQDLDVLAVATPDHLHTQVIFAGLNSAAHVITEKPMCLEIQEADQIIDLAEKKDRIVAVDMHKRY